MHLLQCNGECGPDHHPSGSERCGYIERQAGSNGVARVVRMTLHDLALWLGEPGWPCARFEGRREGEMVDASNTLRGA